MRKVNKNFLRRPLSLRSHRTPYQNAITAVINYPGWFANASALYKSEPVLNALKTIYNEKCAYCEQKPLGSPAQVEHFRPKDGVNGCNHTGYYWLAYEWSNLLLACSNCNSHKRTHFPIQNANRVSEPTLIAGSINEKDNFILGLTLQQEGGMLLNPEIDDPSKHLVFLPSGKIDFLTARGDISIQRYDLNRDELWLNGRKKIIDELMEKFSRRLDRYVSRRISASIVLDELLDIIYENIWTPIINNLSFSTFYRQVLLEFDIFFVHPQGNQRAALLLRMAFLKFIKSL
jgi:uncharacterized protein (TIGR02646 family)